MQDESLDPETRHTTAKVDKLIFLMGFSCKWKFARFTGTENYASVA